MLVARSLHRRGDVGMPIARRQHDDLPPGLAKSKNPNHPLNPVTTPAQPEPATTPAYTTPAGGYRGGTTTTSAGTRTTTTTISSPPSETGDSNKGPTATGHGSNTRTINVGSSYDGPDIGGSSDSTSGTTATLPDPSDSSTSTTASTLNSAEKSSTSGGAIAAAVIFVLLFVIVALVFILRRRSKARRQEQALRWGLTQNRTSKSFGDDEGLNSRRSTRSSFATTFDHSNRSLPAVPPPPPPMAEVGRSSGTAPVLVLDTNAEHNRFSIGSANSDNSQYLVVHHRESLQPENFRASVSVSECMESFSFPKPPPPDGASLHSSKGSRSGFPKIEEPEVLYVASPGIRPTITFSPPADPIQPTLLGISNPFADNNPFDDPATALLAPALSVTAGEVETVRRPFVPQLQDELQVDVGDTVRVVEAFDDQWALVAKISPTSSSKSEQGLIPLECLRDLEPNLLGGKRVSSQGAKIAAAA